MDHIEKKRLEEMAQYQCAALKLVLNHLAFGSGECKAVCFDHMKPLVVPAGRDRFRDIGAPAVDAKNPKAGGKDSRLAQWVRLCEQRFPAQSTKAASEWYDLPRFPKQNPLRHSSRAVVAPLLLRRKFDSEKYAEAEIDALRAHREEEQRVRGAYERQVF